MRTVRIQRMCSLGVVELDLSLSPDAFGLQAFDSKKPLTRMLLGSSPCELRLMLLDSKLGTDGFHDVFTTMKRRARKWSASAEVLVIGQTGRVDTACWGFAPYVK